VMAAYPVPRSAAAVEGTVLPGYGGAAPQAPALQHYAAPGEPMLGMHCGMDEPEEVVGTSLCGGATMPI